MTRADLIALLDTWEAAALPEPRNQRAKVRIPVVHKGKVIGYVQEQASDGRREGALSFLRQVQELRAAIESGADPKLAWLALSVGAGSVQVARREEKYSQRAAAGKARRGHRAAWEPPEEDKPFLAELAKLSKNRSYNSRVKDAARKSNNRKPLSTLRRYGEKAGLK